MVGSLFQHLTHDATSAIKMIVKRMRRVDAAATTGVRSCRSVAHTFTGSVCRVGLDMKIATTTSSQDVRNEKTAAENSPC